MLLTVTDVSTTCVVVIFRVKVSYVGCLPFTWENKLVHRLGKWYAKFRTAKSRSGIAFTICKNQFHSLYRKMATKAWNQYQRYLEEMEHYNFTSFSLLSSRIFLKLFVNDKQPSRPLMVLNSGYWRDVIGRLSVKRAVKPRCYWLWRVEMSLPRFEPSFVS